MRDVVETGIEATRFFHENEAAVAANLDLWKWRNDEYPSWFKTEIMIWYSRHKAVEMHRNDAAAEYARRKAKQRRR